MNQRPRLLVGLALLYLISPFLYPALVSLYFGTPVQDVIRQITNENSWWRNFEVYFVPGLLSISIFFARRLGYFFVIFGSVFLCIRSVFEFLSTNDSAPVSVFLVGNLLFVVAVFYFLRKNTRAIYFNPKIRWWETEARYILGAPGEMARLGAPPSRLTLLNIALGGAALETSEKGFLPHEKILVRFQHDATEYEYTAGVVWHRPLDDGNTMIGVQWITESGRPDRQGMRKMIRELRAKNTPTVGQGPGWWEEIRAWVARS